MAPGCSSVYPSIHSLIHLFVHLPISPSLHVFTHRMVFPSIHLSIHSSVSVPPSQPVNSLPASVFTHPSVHASVHHFLSICLYLCPPSHLSIHPSLSPSLRPPIHPSVLLPIISSTHQSSIHPSLTSTCPFVHLFSNPSTHYLSTQLSYLSFSLIITHSVPSFVLNLLCTGCLGYQGEHLHSQYLGSAATGVYIRRKQSSCVHSHFSNQITVYHLFRDILKSPRTLHVE